MHRVLKAGVVLLLASCAGMPVGPEVGPRPAVLSDSNVVSADPDGNGTQVSAFLTAHREKRTAGLCGITITGDEFDQHDAEACIVTERGKGLVARRLDESRYMLYPLKYLGQNRFELLGTVGQQVVLEPWLPN